MGQGIQVIADGIYLDGDLVATRSERPPASVQARFKAMVEECDRDHEDVLDDLMREARKSATDGLLFMSELSNIVSRLKEPQ